MANKSTAFVIMPYTVKEWDAPHYPDERHWENVFQGLIEPAAREAEVALDRDKEDPKSRHIADGIFSKIERAPLILCDLSSYNSNVFLELGWAMRADKPCVLLKDEKTEFAFDLNQHYTVEYRSDLQPIPLREDIGKLASTIRSTLQDKGKNWSVLKRIGVIVSAIDATTTGTAEVNTQLLLQIREIVSANHGGDDRRRILLDSFVWPRLCREALVHLKNLGDTLTGRSIERPDFQASIRDSLRSMNAEHRPDIQLSIISQNRQFVYHDWERMLGVTAAKTVQEGVDIYDDVFKYDSGAIAWVDRSTNNPSLSRGHTARLNIGLFRPIPGSTAKVLVELHQEL